MKIRQNSWNRIAAFTVAMSLICGWMGMPRPAMAGEVHVEGSVVVFKAGNNEVNILALNARGSAFNPATGQFVQGFTVSDSSAGITPGPGCQALVGAVVCDIFNASLISLDLGDKDDRVSQEQDAVGNAVPMRVKGGAGNDTLTGASGGDDLDGELGDYTIDGGNGNDVLTGGFGVDTITGGAGSDTISAGPGKDIINARDGEKDAINCGLGHDVVTADASPAAGLC